MLDAPTVDLVSVRQDLPTSYVLLVDLFSSTVASTLSKSVFAPLERVKIVYQTSAESKYKGRVSTAHIYLTLRDLVEQQGFRSLWRGNIANVLRYVPHQAVTFVMYRPLLSLLIDSTTWSRTSCSMAAGSTSAGVSGIATYPLFYCQTVMASYLGLEEKSKIKSIRSCLAQRKSIISVYHGFWVSTFGLMFNRAFYFSTYDYLKTQKNKLNEMKTHDEMGVLLRFADAQVASLFANVISYPPELIGRRMVLDGRKDKKMYNGVLDCVIQVYQKEGIWGFFKGNFVNMVRSPGGGIMLFFHDEISNYLFKIHTFFIN